MYTGDENQDGFVDQIDLIATNNDVNIFLAGDRLPTDFTADGFVDLRDLIRCYNNAIFFRRVKSPLNP